jgi:hypothetical protein
MLGSRTLLARRNVVPDYRGLGLGVRLIMSCQKTIHIKKHKDGCRMKEKQDLPLRRSRFVEDKRG